MDGAIRGVKLQVCGRVIKGLLKPSRKRVCHKKAQSITDIIDQNKQVCRLFFGITGKKNGVESWTCHGVWGDNSQHKGLHAPIEGRKLVKAVSGVERTHTKTIPLEDWW
jgi:hypothetical protein